MSRQQELPLILGQIINGARRRAGVGALSDDGLRAEIRDWQRILEPIPADRLEECNLRANRERKVKALLQPHELLEAWRVIREDERQQSPINVDLQGECCYYCNGTGYQVIVRKTVEGSWNEYARPCACAMAPKWGRTERPIMGSKYKRDEYGRFHEIDA